MKTAKVNSSTVTVVSTPTAPTEASGRITNQQLEAIGIPPTAPKPAPPAVSLLSLPSSGADSGSPARVFDALSKVASALGVSGFPHSAREAFCREAGRIMAESRKGGLTASRLSAREAAALGKVCEAAECSERQTAAVRAVAAVISAQLAYAKALASE